MPRYGKKYPSHLSARVNIEVLNVNTLLQMKGVGDSQRSVFFFRVQSNWIRSEACLVVLRMLVLVL
jgi:hypothetical protein